MNDNIIEEITLAPNKPEGEESIITVVGVGGGGGNAVNYMWDIGIRNVRFMICNTDQQALNSSPVDNIVRLGEDGLGAGNDPAMGRKAAMESIDNIRDRLEAMNTKMVFITAGMGGGTGTGAAPVIAKLAREMDILTVAIVTSPLLVEGKIRYEQAMKGIEELKENVDSLLIINNENIQNLYLEDPTVLEAFSKANEILACAAKGIAEIITISTSYINVDFADVSKVMKNSGRAHMSVEAASGSDRAIIAAKQSLTSPLLGHNNITGAQNILLSMATSPSKPMKYTEMMNVLNYIQENARVVNSDGEVRTANIIWGISEKPELNDDLEIVLVATGFENLEEGFEDTYRTKVLAFNDPGSPFERMNAVLSTTKKSATAAAPTVELKSSPLARGERVVLPERVQRYPNIDALLRVPAYIARKAKLVTDIPQPKSTEEKNEHDPNESSLFD